MDDSSIKLDENIIKILKEKFEGFVFETKSSQMASFGNITAFFVKSDNYELIRDFWSKINNTIAVYYQSRLSDEFNKWNIYCFYVVGKSFDRNLKYIIENDTFATRKVVVESNESYDAIFNSFVLNPSLTIGDDGASFAAAEPFEMNRIIREALIGKNVKRIRMTQDAHVALRDIERALDKITSDEIEI
jgi:hypothetical protein